MNRKTLIRGWCDTSDEFLAENLKKIFSELTTPEDIALHNDMVRQIHDMVEVGTVEGFLIDVARYLKQRPKKYLRGIAGRIKQYSMKGA